MTQTATVTGYDVAAVNAAYRNLLEVVAAVEPDVARAIRQELTDLGAWLILIASEN